MGLAMAERLPSVEIRMVRQSEDMKFNLHEAVDGASGESVNCQEPHRPPRAEAPKGVKYLATPRDVFHPEQSDCQHLDVFSKQFSLGEVGSS